MDYPEGIHAGSCLQWYGLLGSGFIAPGSARRAEWSHPEQMIEPCGSGRNGPSSLWFGASPVAGPRNEPPVPTHQEDSKVLAAAGV